MIPSSMGGVPVGSSFMSRSWLVQGQGARGKNLSITSIPRTETTIIKAKNRPYSKNASFTYISA